MPTFEVRTMENSTYRINGKEYKFDEIPKIDIRLFAASQGLDISEDGKTLTCFKAVKKDGEKYYSWYDEDFVYKIGEYAHSDKFDTNILDECSYGLHGCSIQEAFKFGFNPVCNCRAILELKVDISDPDNYVVPYAEVVKLFTFHDGIVDLVLPEKFRFRKCFVVREVPIEKCLLDLDTGNKYRL